MENEPVRARVQPRQGRLAVGCAEQLELATPLREFLGRGPAGLPPAHAHGHAFGELILALAEVVDPDPQTG